MWMIFLYWCPPWFLRQALSLNFKLPSLIRLAGQQALGSACFCLLHTEITDTLCHAKLNMGSEDLNLDAHACTSPFLTKLSPSPFIPIRFSCCVCDSGWPWSHGPPGSIEWWVYTTSPGLSFLSDLLCAFLGMPPCPQSHSYVMDSFGGRRESTWAEMQGYFSKLPCSMWHPKEVKPLLRTLLKCQ